MSDSQAGDLPAIEGGAPVRAERLPFFRPCHGEEEIAAVVETLRSGWLTIGPRTHEFRAAFLDATGLPHGWPLDSCTSGLFLALKVLGIGPGDEVVTTPNTFVSTVNVIHHAGATPVLADIEEETFGLDPERVAAAVTPRTRAVLAVHYGGQPCRIEALRDLADAERLLLVEDAAHAFGAEAGGRPAGSFGEAAAFSFYVTKNLSTGEGGFLTCRDESLEEEIALQSLHGMDQGAWKRYTDRGSWYYEVKRFGYKFNMTDVQAALGLVQLRRAPELLAARTRAAERYLANLAGEEALLLPATRPGARHTWHLFVPRLLAGALRVDRDRFLAALAAENVSPSLHFIPIHHHPAHREYFGDRPPDLPVSERFFKTCFSLPLFPGITDAEVDSACEAVRKLLRHYRR
ncbi:MAG: DegT/DnrJ/EryC1/StrS family aminotransferase [Candidatus Krumholzibacteriota bacterium]|nr:DegT/DnrJ/EryC1/StrS family aminotransferase [Candidatus Krumholzibacteriota bacterium]